VKIAKSQLRKIIKEELNEVSFGLGHPPKSEGEPSFKAKVDAAFQDIGTLDAVRGIENGSYGYEHVAEALRMRAKEFDAAAKTS
jgi:hypothetical protein